MASAVQLLPPAVPLDSSGSAWLQRFRFDLAVCVCCGKLTPGMAAPYGPALVAAAGYYRSVFAHLMQLLELEGMADDPPAVVVVAAEEPAAAEAPAVATGAVLLAPYYDPPDCPPPPLPDLQPAPDVQPAQRNRAAQTPDSWLTEYVRSDGVRIYRC